MDYISGPAASSQRIPLTTGATRIFSTGRNTSASVIRLIADRANTDDICVLFVASSALAPTAADILNAPDYYLLARDTRELEVQPNMEVYARAATGTATLIAKEIFAQG